MTNLVSCLCELRQRAPVGAPLYALRHTKAQHNELVSIVKQELDIGNRDRHVAAGYCLAASRILSTDHPKGPWTWQPVDEHLGKLYNPGPFVKLGLEYWGRPVVVLGTHRWLFTLIAEGGLPIHLIQEQGSVISSFFSRLLTLAESNPQGDVGGELSRCFGMLPESLRNDAVRQLSVDLVRSVRELRVASDGEQDRLGFLDRERPGWRQQLPLSLDDEVSKRLLEGLLDAPRQTDSISATGIAVITSLRRQAIKSDEYTLVHAIQLPQYVSRHGLARQLGIEADSLPKRFTLNLVDIAGATTPLATVTPAVDEHRFHLEAGRRLIRLGKTNGPVLLQATRRGQELGPAVRVSQELGEMPWVFADDEAGQELVSVGPCTTSRQSVLAATTDGASVQPLEDEVYDSAATLVGTLPNEDRYLYRLHGKVKVEVAGEFFSVRTNATHDESYSVQMRGQRIVLLSGLVWLGVPRFFIQDVGGEREVPTTALSWRPKGSVGAWRAVDQRCIGEVQMRVRWDRQVVHRSSEIILPAAFSFELQPGAQNGVGEIFLKGLGVARVSPGGDPSDVDLAVRTLGNARYSLSCTARAECIAVSLTLEFYDTAASVTLPFPGHYVGFVDASGRSVSPGAHLDVSRLHAVRARALSGRSSNEFLLLARATGMREVALATLRCGSEGVTELSLGHVKEQVEGLLSDGLDATAELYLAPKGSVVHGKFRRRGIKIHWYGNRLVRNFDPPNGGADDQRKSLAFGGVVSISLKVPNDTDIPVRVFAHQMTDPTMDNRVELPGGEASGWTFASTARSPGPWIVTAWRGEVLLSRPTLVVVPGALVDETTGALEHDGLPNAQTEAAPAGHPLRTTPVESEDEQMPPLESIVDLPDRKVRQSLMRAAIRRMATDASHPGWVVAQGFLDSMKLFPADSYEFNRATFEHPEATALVMLRGAFLGHTEHLWAGFEQFHFLWVTFPLRAWTRAVRIYRNTAFPSVPEESRPPLLKLAMERCFTPGETSQYRFVIWDLCASTINGIPAAPKPIRLPDGQQRRMIARHLTQLEMERVEQHHSDETYPQLPPTDELVPPPVASVIAELTPEVGMGFRGDVARAPVLAAAISVHALNPSRELLFELRRARDFDSKYFDNVYNDSLACLALDALDANPDHFN